MYAYVFNQPTSLRDPSGMVVDPISWTAVAIVCGGGATVGASYVVLSGRKPTVENLATGAAVGCGAGMLMLVSWIVAAAAGATAVTADIAGSTVGVAEIAGAAGGVFTTQEALVLRQAFGRGVTGARRVLQSIENGTFVRPEGLTPELLERYRQVALEAIQGPKGDKLGTQALRLQIIQRLSR